MRFPQAPLFSEASCQSMVKKTLAVKEGWVYTPDFIGLSVYKNITEFMRENSGGNFPYIYGAALYLMGGNSDTYKEYLARTAPVLESIIDYERLRLAFSDLLGLPCQYAPGLAKPGLNIFYNGLAVRKAESYLFHTDYYEPTVLPVPTLEHIATCTVFLRAPACGASLDYMERGKEKSLDYAAGRMYSWPASLPHRVGAMVLNPGELRLSIQGHAYMDANRVLNLYW